MTGMDARPACRTSTVRHFATGLVQLLRRKRLDMSKYGFSVAFVIVPVVLAIPAGAGFSSGTERCTIVAITGGGYHFSLALAQDGGVYGWGKRSSLGAGESFELATRPIRSLSPNPGPMRSVGGGDAHGLAIRSDGTAWAWGNGWEGELGDGTYRGAFTPVQVLSLLDVRVVDGGYMHSMALDGTGAVWAWGDNQFGQLGNGTNDRSNVPVQVLGLSGIVGLSSAYGQGLAVRDDGTVWAWGSNGCAQLGDGTFDDRNTPVRTQGISNAVAVAAGWCHSLALLSDGRVLAWGDNAEGQLGDGTGRGKRIPVLVPSLDNVVALAGGGGTSFAIRGDGTLWGWGDDSFGQVGNGPPNFNEWTPKQVTALSNVIAVSGGKAHHSLAVTADGSAWAWGNGSGGTLGNGDTANSSSPIRVDFDYLPPDQGNLLRAVKLGDDVELIFEGAQALLWEVDADFDKTTIGRTPLAAEMTERWLLDVAAVSASDSRYYHVRGLSLCSLMPGP